MEPIRSGNTLAYFSYADDIRILGIGRRVRESAIIEQREVDGVINGQQNAVSFDVKISEIV